MHAYVLMTNHVHLLLTPDQPGRVSVLMQSLGRRYVRYVNDRYHRTGTLWEGRYKSCLVDKDTYLLHCHRYIELNPVRAHMAVDAGDYEWSSYHRNALGKSDQLIRPHATYNALGTRVDIRCMAYRKLVEQSMDAKELDTIREHLQRQHALGSNRFRTAIETMLNRRAGPAKIGRPRKLQNESKSAL